MEATAGHESMTESDYLVRIRLLRAEVGQLRRQTDLNGTGATIHQLRNHVGAAEGALRMGEARLRQDTPQDLELLLDLARLSLRDGRALIARLQQGRFTKNHRTIHDGD